MGRLIAPFDKMVAFEKLNESLPGADVVSIHLRATPKTIGLFDAARFGLMNNSALFLNTSRGVVVHEPDLIDALPNKWIRGAYLDVFCARAIAGNRSLLGHG